MTTIQYYVPRGDVSEEAYASLWVAVRDAGLPAVLHALAGIALDEYRMTHDPATHAVSAALLRTANRV